LIDAVEQAVNNPEFQAVDAGQPLLVHIIGIQEEGPYLEQIKNVLQERSNLPIVLHDPVAPEELKKYYQAADFFLLPSRSEGFNVSLLEACSCGLPIVATKVGGNHLVVRSHHTGKLAEANNADAFAKALIDVRSGLEKFNPNTIRKRIVNEFDLSVLSNRLSEQYRKMVK
jgi:glycosyltransferase involved in cell wall biosynthesis